MSRRATIAASQEHLRPTVCGRATVFGAVQLRWHEQVSLARFGSNAFVPEPDGPRSEPYAAVLAPARPKMTLSALATPSMPLKQGTGT